MQAQSTTKNAAGASPSVNDPIIKIISDYRAGCAAFDAMDDIPWDDRNEYAAVVKRTYGDPMEALENWKSPAVTWGGALEALRLALDECAISYTEPKITNMVRSAYDYYRENGGVA